MTLGAFGEMRKLLADFVAAEGIAVEVVSGEDCTVRVVRAEDGAESDVRTLRAGGWIACAAARAMASRLGIEPGELGRLLDHLHVKVRKCELGLF